MTPAALSPAVRVGIRRFTMADANAIRAAALQGRTNVSLAREYGCNKETIGRIVRGDTYLRYIEQRPHNHRTLGMIEGLITFHQLREAAAEYDECSLDGELTTAAEFIAWLRFEIEGARAA